jgi:hypothetical protein
VKPTSPRQAYNALAKYFGLRARDEFLNPLAASTTPTQQEGQTKSGSKSSLLEELFGTGANYETLESITKTYKEVDLKKEDFCLTTLDGAEKDDLKKIYNSPQNSPDQGIMTGDGKLHRLKDIVPALAKSKAKAGIFQIFPSATGIDVVDTEIASLFLNSLTTLNLSRAVPYLEVKIVTEDVPEKGAFASAPKMSLGKFLSAPDASEGKTTDALLATFITENESTGAEGAPLSVVAGMEVFTSPQTLVNLRDASGQKNTTRYNRAKGGRVDAFRPFLGITNFEANDVFSGGGTISYKSAKMTMMLFDKGRLSEVAEFVAPRRDPNIKFEITYGWAHPDGKNRGRLSDADVESRLGRLVDSMRVTEVYTLKNSTYTVNVDGTVEISLDLTMDGSSPVASKTISSLSLTNGNSRGVALTDLTEQLNEIKNSLLEANSNLPRRLDLPLFVQSPSVASMLTLDDKTIEAIEEFAKSVKKQKKAVGADATAAAAKLIKIFGNRGAKNKLVTSRQKVATDFVKALRKSPDPFLRENKGVTARELGRGSNRSRKFAGNQKYVSLGKLLFCALFPAVESGRDDIEAQFVFSCFNADAGGVYDMNTAQFPIQLKDFEDQLKNYLKKRAVVTISDFIRFLSDKFLTFDGTEAFGLSDIVKPNSRGEKGTPVGTNKTKNLLATDNAENKLKLAELQRKNLEKLYGKNARVHPTYTKPRINVRLDTKKSKDEKKTIVRIYVQDMNSGRLMSTADALTQFMREGISKQDSFPDTPNARGAKHGEIYAQNFKKLEDDGIIGQLNPDQIKKVVDELKKQKVKDKKIKDIENKMKKYKVMLKAPDDLRNFYFQNSPYLLHGTEGSGIIEAQISSESDQNLTNIFLAKRFSGKGDTTKPASQTTLPFYVHPGQLSLTLVGCPVVKLTQKFFVDFATGTTLDNYYHVTSVTHTIANGEYKTAVQMKPYDAYGKFANIQDDLEKLLIKSAIAEVATKKKNKKK